MGAAFSNTVELEMPIRKASKKAKARHASRDTQARVNGMGKVKSLTKVRGKDTTTGRAHSYEDLKDNRDLRATPIQLLRRKSVINAATDLPRRNVLVIEEIENDSGSFSFSGSLVRFKETDSSHLLMEQYSVMFDDLLTANTHTYDKGLISHEKAKRFVSAWRAGRAYPRARKERIISDIPLAATSICRSRHTVYCTACYHPEPESIDTTLIDMTLRENQDNEHDLDIKSHQKLKKLPAYMSVLIVEDLRNNSYTQQQSHGQVANLETTADERDEMIIVLRLIIPPPVMIHYTKEKNLYEKDVAKLKHVGKGQMKKFREVHNALTQHPEARFRKLMNEIQAKQSQMRIHGITRKPAVLD